MKSEIEPGTVVTRKLCLDEAPTDALLDYAKKVIACANDPHWDSVPLGTMRRAREGEGVTWKPALSLVT